MLLVSPTQPVKCLPSTVGASTRLQPPTQPPAVPKANTPSMPLTAMLTVPTRSETAIVALSTTGYRYDRVPRHVAYGVMVRLKFVLRDAVVPAASRYGPRRLDCEYEHSLLIELQSMES